MATGSVIHLSPGDVLGRYRVEAFVAKGGMGDIFRAWDDKLERQVALKTIREEYASTPEAMNRFLREAQILAQLNHPGICQVYDWVEHQGSLVIAMEWVEGDTLAARIAQGALPPATAVPLLRNLAAALAVAHAKGIIHRDLKPSNILLTPEGLPKILDFGLAKSFGGDPPTGTMAPKTPLLEEEATRPGASPSPTFTETGALMGTWGLHRAGGRPGG